MSTSNELLNKIAKNRGDYALEVGGIRQSRDLSNEGKARKLAAAYQRATAQHQKLKAQYAQEIDSTRQHLEGKAFSAPVGMTAEYRLAVQAASSIENPDDRRKAMDLARKTGDTLLLRAHATIAHAQGDWANVLSLADSDKDITNLIDFERNEGGRLATPDQKFGRNVALHAPEKPMGVPNQLLNSVAEPAE